jgi:hypothetical protein
MDENLWIISDKSDKAQNEQRKGREKKKVQDERTQVLANEESSQEREKISLKHGVLK